MLQSTASGAVLGLFYALVASGLYITVVGAGLYNLAYGAGMLASGYAAFALDQLGFSLPAAFLGALAVGVLLGLGAEASLRAGRAVPGVSGGPEQGRAIVLTLALAFLIDASLQAGTGSDPRRLSLGLESAGVGIGAVRVVADQAMAAAVAVVLVMALDLLLTRRPLGRALRAAGQDSGLAQAFRLDPAHYRRVAWGLSGLLSGISGFLFATVAYLQPYGEENLLFAAIALVVAVAPGRAVMLLGAGALLGAVQGGASYWLGVQWQTVWFFLAFALVVLVRAGKRSWT
jgi:branched-subunit amino acid ABC-type transport system permease component